MEKIKEPASASASRILIVEDEVKLLQHLQQLYHEHGFAVETASTLAELEQSYQAAVTPFDVVILDRLLQGRDAASLIGAMKNAMPQMKILILSALDSSSEKAKLLDRGADDYLAKPFDSEELVARSRVLLRRNKAGLSCGNLVLDPERRTLLVGDHEIELQNKEYLLLRTLMQTPGKVHSRTSLYLQIWKMTADTESNVLETTVNKLRRRLKEAQATVQIKNSRNLGYWIEI
jgi:two-component system OmpR family response regulator